MLAKAIDRHEGDGVYRAAVLAAAEWTRHLVASREGPSTSAPQASFETNK